MDFFFCYIDNQYRQKKYRYSTANHCFILNTCRMNFTGKKDSSLQDLDMPSYESVAKYMAKNVINFTEEQPLKEAIDIMLEKRISGGPVLNAQGKLVGMLSEKDCLRLIVDHAYHNHPGNIELVKNYMSGNVKTISIDSDVFDVANEFLTSNFRRFPVVDEQGKLKGQVSRRDIMKAARNLKKTTW